MSVIVDQRKEALAYLKKHDLLKLFDILGSKLAKGKPGDPNAFLLSELEVINEAKANKEPITLFNEEDIKIMFAMFNLTGKGFVTNDQYLKALNAVGVQEPKLFPLSNDAKIDKDTFISQM